MNVNLMIEQIIRRVEEYGKRPLIETISQPFTDLVMGDVQATLPGHWLCDPLNEGGESHIGLPKKSNIRELERLKEIEEADRAYFDRRTESAASYLETNRISSQQRNIASSVLTRVGDSMGLTVGAAKWFKEVEQETKSQPLMQSVMKGPTSLIGRVYTTTKQIWIRYDLKGVTLVSTCVHELSHLWRPQYVEEEVIALTAYLVEGRQLGSPAVTQWV